MSFLGYPFRPRLVGVLAAVVLVTIAPPAGAAQTVVYTNDFSSSAGSEWSPSAVISTAPLGEHMLGNPFSGSFTESLTLTGLPAHTQVTISFDLYILGSWDGNGDYNPQFGPDFWSASVAGGPTLQPTTTFAHVSPCSGSQSYPDPYPATNPANTGAAAVDTLGFGPGCYGDSTYHFSFTVAHAASSVTFDFTGATTEPWADEGWGLDNVEVSVTPFQTVGIDIKPGSFPNSINTANRGVIAVAVLGTSTFDVSDVDPSTVCFGDAEDAGERDCTVAPGTILEDVNFDGFPDLVLHFETQETGIDPGDTQACLTGELFDSTSIEGCDSVKTK